MWDVATTVRLNNADDCGGVSARGRGPDARRWLQLALATLWLLDGMLQFQPFMYGMGFAETLAGVARSNPKVIAVPIAWAASLVGHHPVATDTAFAAIQVLLGLGIACRATVRPALATSVVWAGGVWWFGEGLGGVLNGTASPVNGAPGAVILYAVLAVLLWPAVDRGGSGPFVAAGAVGGRAAKALWLLLWGGLAYLAVMPVNRTGRGLSPMIAGMAAGEPHWLVVLDHSAAILLTHYGQAAAVGLAALLVAIAVSVALPAPVARAGVVGALAVTLLIWVVGENFGGILTGGGTDPNTGPLLALLAVAYWPAAAPVGIVGDERIVPS